MGERQNERSRGEQTRDRREPSGSWRVKFWAPGTGNEAQGLYHVMCMCALIGNQSGRTRFMLLVLSRCHSMTRELARASPCLLGRPNDRIIIHIYSFMNLCELNKIDLTMKTEEVTRLMQFCGSSLKFRFLRSGFVFRSIRTSNKAFCYFINLILYNYNTKYQVYFTVLFPCQEWNNWINCGEILIGAYFPALVKLSGMTVTFSCVTKVSTCRQLRIDLLRAFASVCEH